MNGTRDVRTRLAEAREWGRERVRLDRRALAALRIALGSLLLLDLSLRATDLVAHYTDRGVLPRAALAETYPAFARVSLHALSGSVWFVAGLFALAGLAALALLVGYRTRLATAGSLLLLVSLHARNPVLLNAGDSLLRRLLLWGLFLPLGRRWSLDALSRGKPADTDGVASLATAALLVQVVLVYVVNALVKLRGERWLEGTAVRYVFGVDGLTILLGDAMAEFPMLLELLGWGWLALLVASPLLLVGGRVRTGLALALAAGHLGMALTMRLGVFPLVSMTALLPFLPPRVWAWADRHVADRASFARLDRGFLARLPRGPGVPARVAEIGRRLAPAVVAVLLVAMLAWNAMALGFVETPAAVSGSVDPADYRWDMFAPEPRSVDGWYVTVARTPSGEQVDPFRGGAVEWDPPEEVAATYPSHRWYVYLLDLQRPGGESLRGAFGRYLCERGPRDPTRVAVYYVTRPVELAGPEPTERKLLGRYDCS